MVETQRKLNKIIGNAWQHGLAGLAIGALFGIFGTEPKGVLLVVGLIMLGVEVNQYRCRVKPYDRDKWLHSVADIIIGMLGGVLSFVFYWLMKVTG